MAFAVKRPRPLGSLWRDDSGTVFLEFLVVLVPLWGFFLALVQLALIAHADLLVRHAADSAARSAVVVLPDDPRQYGGAPEMTLDRGRIGLSELTDVLGQVSGSLGSAAASIIGPVSEGAVANVGRSRLNTIRMAAHVPLMPLAPLGVRYEPNPSVAKSLSQPRSLLSAIYYQPFAVSVTFPGFQGEYPADAEVTVRVTYAYACTVPLARKLLCQGFAQLDTKEDLGGAFLALAEGIVGGRFKGIQHETTLLIHDAPYEYRPPT